MVAGDGAIGADYITTGPTNSERHKRLWVDEPGKERFSFRQLLSPERDMYFYVEQLPLYFQLGAHINPEYDDYPPDPQRRSRVWRGHVPWDQNEPALRVHVYRATGEPVTSIDLPRSYGGVFDSAFWLGIRMICLQNRVGHLDGNFYSTFVNVETGEKRLVGWRGLQPQATTDSQHVLFEHKGVLYDNFRPVYPFYGDVLPDFGTKEGWAAYREKYYVRREPYPHQRAQGRSVQQFFLTPDRQRIVSLATGGPTTGPQTAASQILTIDLDQIERAKDPKAYARVVATLPDVLNIRLDRAQAIAPGPPVKTDEILVLDTKDGRVI